MIFRRLVFSALRMALQNPAVRRQAGHMAQTALKAATPSLMAASRRAGQAVRGASDELQEGMKKFKAARDGEDTETPQSGKAVPKGPMKNITPGKNS